MRKLYGMALLALLVVPSVASTQQRRAAQRPAATGAKHEIGVDLSAAYVKPESVDGGIVIGTPVDLRWGFVTRNKLQWEGRLGLLFGTVGGGTQYAFRPGVNVLYAMAPGTNRRGMYLTGGGSMLLADDGADSGTQLGINAAVGWRKPWGNAAWRYELGFGYNFESQDLGLASSFQIGGRIGVSFWH